jgi:hypothetical protein
MGVSVLLAVVLAILDDTDVELYIRR